MSVPSDELLVTQFIQAIAVEILRQGYPRDIRHAVWQLDEYRLAAGGKPGGVLPLNAA